MTRSDDLIYCGCGLGIAMLSAEFICVWLHVWCQLNMRVCMCVCMCERVFVCSLINVRLSLCSHLHNAIYDMSINAKSMTHIYDQNLIFASCRGPTLSLNWRFCDNGFSATEWIKSNTHTHNRNKRSRQTSQRMASTLKKGKANEEHTWHITFITHRNRLQLEKNKLICEHVAAFVRTIVWVFYILSSFRRFRMHFHPSVHPSFIRHSSISETERITWNIYI